MKSKQLEPLKWLFMAKQSIFEMDAQNYREVKTALIEAIKTDLALVKQHGDNTDIRLREFEKYGSNRSMELSY